MRRHVFASAAAVAAVVLAVGTATSGGSATAASQIDGGAIKSGTITEPKYKTDSVGNRALGPSAVTKSNLAPHLYDTLARDTDTPDVLGAEGAYAQTDAPVTLAHVGGPVRQNKTDLGDLTVHLAPGVWQLTGYAMFTRTTKTTGPETDASLVLWRSETKDGAFEDFGQGVGTYNARLMPEAEHDVTASGFYRVTVTEPDGLWIMAAAHAYNDDQSDANSGTVAVTQARVQAVLVGQPTGNRRAPRR